jgi:hypothetical protein
MIRAGAEASLAEGRLAVAQQPCRRISLIWLLAVRRSSGIFEELYVQDGAIVGWKARVERAPEIEWLMGSVGGYREQPAELA